MLHLSLFSNEQTHHKDKQHKRKEKYVCMQ